jgi:2-methylisocitrate lyase-like PEP mutase family enzyme
MAKPTTILKPFLAKRQATILAGAANGLFARVIEDLGYEAVYVTGAGVANMYLGALTELVCDIEQMLGELVRRHARQPKSKASSTKVLQPAYFC